VTAAAVDRQQISGTRGDRTKKKGMRGGIGRNGRVNYRLNIGGGLGEGVCP
jgi:hypothetical protein